MVCEVGSLDYERVSFPSADGMPEQRRFAGRRMLTAVKVDNPFGVHPVNLHCHAVALNSYGICDRIEHQCRCSYRDAILLRICLRICIRQGRLALVRYRPVSHTAKKAIEFGARGEPRPCNTRGGFVSRGIDTARSN